MTEPIFETSYWRKRLNGSRHEPHYAVFKCPLDRWRRIEGRHRELLAKYIRPKDSILDAGCGYGRLLDLLPHSWEGCYLGIDLSPDMIREAMERYGNRRACTFAVGDLRELPQNVGPFDWAILVSLRPMVVRNAGLQVWHEMERELRRASKRLLVLEYDESDGGSVE